MPPKACFGAARCICHRQAEEPPRWVGGDANKPGLDLARNSERRRARVGSAKCPGTIRNCGGRADTSRRWCHRSERPSSTIEAPLAPFCVGGPALPLQRGPSRALPDQAASCCDHAPICRRMSQLTAKRARRVVHRRPQSRACISRDCCPMVPGEKGKIIPHRLENCGYVPVRSEATDGLWIVDQRRQADLSIRDRFAAAQRLSTVGR